MQYLMTPLHWMHLHSIMTSVEDLKHLQQNIMEGIVVTEKPQPATDLDPRHDVLALRQ